MICVLQVLHIMIYKYLNAIYKKSKIGLLKIKPIIEFVCSHIDKYSCWSVKNIKTDQKYNLLDRNKNSFR